MTEIECPVRIQKEYSPSELLDSLPHGLTEEDRVEQYLQLGDAYTRLACNVGDCTVRAILEDRHAPLVHRQTFQVVNASHCQRLETALSI